MILLLTRHAKRINDKYYEWLCDLIKVAYPQCSFWFLIKHLHSKPFTWTVFNDDNRAFDGKVLREQFCDEMRYNYCYEDFDEAASMLELILGLAYRCESIMVDQPDNMSVSDWFWKILHNVGLDKFTDDAYRSPNWSVSLDNILNIIINRTYNRYGQGGLFPLQNTKKDQRKVELWYQMSAYLVENYYMDGMIL